MDKPLNVRAAIAAGLTVEWHGADYPGWYVKRTRVAHELVGGVEEYWDTVPAYSTVGEAMGLLEAWSDNGPMRRYTVYHCDPRSHEIYRVRLIDGNIPANGYGDTLPAAILEALASTP